MSPCLKVCQLDPITQMCIGCKRTMEEIKIWRVLTEEEKLKVIQSLEKRANLPPLK